MSTISELHAAALQYAARGWAVFPCRPDSKIPATPHGHKNATNDINQINQWWTENPQYNIAICPEDQNLAVIEHDAYKGGSIESLNLPETFEVASPQGGIHYYFVGSLPPTANKLGEYIDTRGRNSYVLIPPSIVKGKKYYVRQDRLFAPLPVEIENRIALRNLPLQKSNRILEIPQANTERARSRLHTLASDGDIAIAGFGGNQRTYQIACELIRDLGIRPDIATQLMLEEWNNECDPPWSEAELLEICNHAANYGQNEPGVFATAAPSKTFQPIKPPNKFKIYDGAAMMAIPEPKWLIPDFIPEKSIGVFSAPKGNFKSFLALDLGMGIATAKETFAGLPLSQGPVFYAAHEGFDALGRMHYAAWCAAKGIDPYTDHGFYLTPGLRIARDGESQSFGDSIQDKIDEIGQTPKLIILDTYSRTMAGLDENNPNDATTFIDFCYDLIKAWPSCSVLTLAHKGKDPSKGTRGSSSLEAAMDFVIDLSREPHSNIVKAHVRFQRIGKERETPFTLVGETVEGSLVFKTIPTAEVSSLQRIHNVLDYRNIAHILRNLGAVNSNIAVTTEVLATTLTGPAEKNDSPEVYSAKVTANIAALNRLAKGKLKALTFGEGKHLRWVVEEI